MGCTVSLAQSAPLMNYSSTSAMVIDGTVVARVHADTISLFQEEGDKLIQKLLEGSQAVYEDTDFSAKVAQGKYFGKYPWKRIS